MFTVAFAVLTVVQLLGLGAFALMGMWGDFFKTFFGFTIAAYVWAVQVWPIEKRDF